MISTALISTKVQRRATLLYTAAAVISLIGLADAIYLTVEHISGRSVRCMLTSGCSEVLSSPYAAIRGVPLAFLRFQSRDASGLWISVCRQTIACDSCGNVYHHPLAPIPSSLRHSTLLSVLPAFGARNGYLDRSVGSWAYEDLLRVGTG